MAAPSPSFAVIPVFGTWRTLNGDPVDGLVRFTVSTRVVSITDNIIFPKGSTWDEPLGKTSGSISISLPAVDDTDNTPVDWSIHVQEMFSNAQGESYDIKPKLAMLPVGLNLRSVIPPGATNDPAESLIRGVRGGIAGLDADGDVIDAFGTKVRGQGGGGTTTTLADLGLTQGIVFQNYSDTVRRSVPAGYTLFIIGGSAPPTWMHAGDVQLATA